MDLTIDQMIAQMLFMEMRRDEWDEQIIWAYIRSAYGQGYLAALQADNPDLGEAQKREREAWARLP